jgi:hypothetical protein
MQGKKLLSPAGLSYGRRMNQIEELFGSWQVAMNRPRAQLTRERSQLLGRWLAEGYSFESLQLALVGARNSSWHQGMNDWKQRIVDIEVLFKDAKSIDRLIEMGERELAKEQERINRQNVVEARTPMPQATRDLLNSMLKRRAT